MKYYGSPRWTNEIADCSMPMTFDTYSNCSFGCMYCFAQFQRAIGNGKEAYKAKEVYPVNVDKIIRMFTDPDKYAGQFATYIKQRRVMQWGGMSDQFDGYERKYGQTLRLLRFFKEIDYPLCFSTKATWWTEDERYISLFRGQKNWNVKFSVITLDQRKAHIIERGVPTPLERLKAIETIANADAGGGNFETAPVHHRRKHAYIPRPNTRSRKERGDRIEYGVLLCRAKKQNPEGVYAEVERVVRI